MEQYHLVHSADLNGSGRLFGGALLSWIDNVAGIVGMRHSGHNITTAFLNQLHFIRPAYANDIVVLTGEMIYTGRTSMEIRVCSYIEKKTGERELINKAFVVVVAIDENNKPTEIPELICETEQEKQEFEEGRLRRANRKNPLS
ncbi:MAG: acyl-CoA thioesterase [Firmicutes bacterium]|nr:acyl-CoA thioesterase [Candidatus Caballimonas caccae]